MDTGRKKIMIVIGTRPEMIKLAPLVLHIQRTASDLYETIVVFTGQHEDLVGQAADVFGIHPDFELHAMHADDDLTHLTSRLLVGMADLLTKVQPDLLIVQGDTTTAFAAGLAAFYQHIPIAHVEAGLRTRDIYSPFPEEVNRTILARLATINFAPTHLAGNNLTAEGVERSRIVVTGNTVVDAIGFALKAPSDPAALAKLVPLDGAERLILVTMHRRETWDKGIARACSAIRMIVQENPDIRIALPVHPGPVVHNRIYAELDKIDRIHLLPPLDYLTFIGLAARSRIFLTDSGGLQEEGSALHKPVIVLRDTTERYEALDAGGARLVGTDPDKIIRSVMGVLNSPDLYRQMSEAPNPFGDGHAAKRIADSLHAWFTTGAACLPREAEFSPIPGRQTKPNQKRHIA